MTEAFQKAHESIIATYPTLSAALIGGQKFVLGTGSRISFYEHKKSGRRVIQDFGYSIDLFFSV